MREPERVCEEARGAFPEYRVHLVRVETTMKPYVVLISAERFDLDALERIASFARERGVEGDVGGNGVGFHSARFL